LTSPELREAELSHLELALREIPVKKKPGPRKGFKRKKVKGTRLPKPSSGPQRTPEGIPTGPGVTPG
jgi:hypothetical protein